MKLNESNLESIVHCILAEFGAKTWGADGFQQSRWDDEWELTEMENETPGATYKVWLLRASENTPVGFEISVDGRRVARVGLTRHELRRALEKTLAPAATSATPNKE